MTNKVLNPDRSCVEAIKKALKRSGGYCPCIKDRSPDTICPCADFRNNDNCHCNLYVNPEEQQVLGACPTGVEIERKWFIPLTADTRKFIEEN